VVTLVSGSGVTVSGNTLSYNGTAIATFSGGAGSTPLTVTFSFPKNSDGTYVVPPVQAVQAVVDSVAFYNTSATMSAYDRTLKFVLADSALSSAAVSVTIHVVVNPPVINSISSTVNYTAGSGAVVALAANFTVTQGSRPLAGSTLTVTNTTNPGGYDDISVSLVSGNGITISGDSLIYSGATIGTFGGGTGSMPLVVQFTAVASTAAVQAALENVTFSNSNPSMSAYDRTIKFVLTDSTGVSSQPVTQTVHVVATPPALGDLGSTVTFAVGSNESVIVAAGATVTSGSNGLASSTLTASVNSTDDNDVMMIVAGGHITLSGNTLNYDGNAIGTFNSGSGSTPLVVTFNNTAITTAMVQAVLDNVAFANSDPITAVLDRTISFTLTDDTAVSSAATSKTIHFSTPPVISNLNSSVNFTVGSAAVVVASGATVTAGNNGLNNATLTVAVGSAESDDTLTIDAGSGITLSGSALIYNGTAIGSFDGGAGSTPLTVTFNNSATAAAVEAVLDNLAFYNSNSSASAYNRTIGISLSDSFGTTVTGTVTLEVQDNGLTATNPSYVLPLSGSVSDSLSDLGSDSYGYTTWVSDVGGVGTDGSFTTSNGTVTVSNGSFTYMPTAGFIGNDSFNYMLTNNTGATASGTVNLVVDSLAVSDFNASLSVNNTLSGNVLINNLINSGSGSSPSITSAETSAGTTTPDTNGQMSFTTDNGGTVTMSSDGSFTYAASDFTGSDSFSYTLSDGLLTVTANVHFLVSDPLQVTNPTYTLSQAGSVSDTFDGWGSDSDGNEAVEVTDVGDAGTNGSFSTTNGGTVTVSNSSFTYTPDPNFIGTDSFRYTISDASGTTVMGTVTLDVEDHGLVATNPTYVLPMGGSVGDSWDSWGRDSYGYTTWVSDIGGAGTNGSFTTNNGGSVSVSGGSFTYNAPSLSFNGTDSFNYTLTDTTGATTTGTVSLVVDPLAVNDFDTSLSVNSSVSGNVFANGNLTTGLGPLPTVTSAGGVNPDDNGQMNFTTAAGGTVTMNTDGSFTYSAAPATSDSFSYTLSDGLAIVTANVNFSISDPLAANDSNESGLANSSLSDNVLTNGSVTNAGVGSLSVTSAGGATPDGNGQMSFTTANGGNVTMHTDGSFSYTPDPSFTGNDSFSYTLSDRLVTVTANVNFSISDPLVATNPTYMLSQAGSVSDTFSGWGTDSDGNEGVGITDVGGAGTDGGLFTTTGGIVTIGNGSFTYTPNPTFNGTDSFNYTVSDTSGTTVTGTVTLEVQDNGLTATNPSYVLPLSGSVSDSLSDLGTDSYGYTTWVSDVGGVGTSGSFTTTGGGTITVGDGSFTYTPSSGFSGSDSFNYTLTDNTGATATGVVNLMVDPLAVSDFNASLSVNNSVTGNVLTNNLINAGLGSQPTITSAGGVTPDGNGQMSFTTANGGTVTMSSDGSFTYAASDFTGSDSVSYTLSDGLLTVTANVHFLVSDPLTITVPGDQSLDQDTTLTFAANNAISLTDPDASCLDVILTVGYGTLTLGDTDGLTFSQGTGSGDAIVEFRGTIAAIDAALAGMTYAPTLGFADTDVLSIVADDLGASPDGQDHTTSQSINLNVSALTTSDADLWLHVGTDTSAGANLFTNVSGGSATLSQIGDQAFVAGQSYNTAQNGSVTVAADGSFLYAPATGFTGDDYFTYTVADAAGSTATATLWLHVDLLAAGDFTADNIHIDAPWTFDLDDLMPGIQSNYDGLVLQAAGDAQHGSIAQSPEGDFTFTPDAGFLGNASFTYTVSDGHFTSTGTVTVAVTNNPPEIDGDFVLPSDVASASGVTVDELLDAMAAMDDDGDTLGLAISGAGDGWEYSTNGGTSWSSLADTSPTHTLLLSGDALLRTPAGSVPSSLSVAAWDQTFGAPNSYIDSTVLVNAPNSTLSDGAVESTIYGPPELGLLEGLGGGQVYVGNGPIYLNESAALNIFLGQGATNWPLSFVWTVTGPENQPVSVSPNQQGDGTANFTPTELGSYIATVAVTDAFGQQGINYGYINMECIVDPDTGDEGGGDGGGGDGGGGDNNPSPIANDDTFDVTQGSGNVLSNDDANGAGTLTATLVGDAQHGTVTLNSDGSFTYTPDDGYVGDDSFTYEDDASDGQESNVAMANLKGATATLKALQFYVPNSNATEATTDDNGNVVDATWSSDAAGTPLITYGMINNTLRILGTVTLDENIAANSIELSGTASGTGVSGQTLNITLGGTLNFDPNSSSYLGVVESSALPDCIDEIKTLSISWKVSLDNGQSFQSVGTMNAVLYDVNKQLFEPYQTELKIATEAGAGLSAEQITDDPQGMAEQIFNVGFESLNVQRVDGEVLTYYENWIPPAIYDYGQLITSADGRCGNWANLLQEVLIDDGITGSSVVDVTSNQQVGDGIEVGQNQYASGILVYSFDFDGNDVVTFDPPHRPNGDVDWAALCAGNQFNWQPADPNSLAGDLPGIEAQGGIENPQALFPDHALIQVGSVYFDPSYGAVYDSQLAFQQAAIAGVWGFITVNGEQLIQIQRVDASTPLLLNFQVAPPNA
jgi:hypothetical protein